MKKRLLQARNKLRANKDKISTAKFNGKDHIIVSGVTHMIADAVMNGIMYPGSEVRSLAANLEGARVTMPAEHPEIDGTFVSASDPLALNSNFIGAFAFNFSMRGDRLISDVAIDKKIAAINEHGSTIVGAIESGEPVDMSTGFFLELNEESGIGQDGEPFEAVAANLHMDHSAFLPVSTGAKNKSEGVGLHTNRATLKGEQLDTDIADVTNNASSPALRLPLAPVGHVWNEDQALGRIKAFTNSENAPSTNFRKFFLNFDQDNVDSFDSYTGLFADVIGGVPHAVKGAVVNVEDDTAKAYVNRFNSQTNNSSGLMAKIGSFFKSVFASNQSEISHDDIREMIWKKLNEGRSGDAGRLWPLEVFDDHFVYHDESDKLFMQTYTLTDGDVVFDGTPQQVERKTEFIPVTNSNEDLMDRKDIIALLEGKGIQVNAEISDSDLKAELEKALTANTADDGGKGGQQNNNLAEQIATAVSNAIKPLEDRLNANANKEKDDLVEQVVALNKGLDEEAAKLLSPEKLRSFLAANGQASFNGNGHFKPNHDSGDQFTAEMPE